MTHYRKAIISLFFAIVPATSYAALIEIEFYSFNWTIGVRLDERGKDVERMGDDVGRGETTLDERGTTLDDGLGSVCLAIISFSHN